MSTVHLGLLAGSITTLAAVPQVVKTYRTKHARDISIWQPILLNMGMALWLLYGFLLRDIPLIMANSVSLLCYTSLIIMKVAYRDNEPEQETILDYKEGP